MKKDEEEEIDTHSVWEWNEISVQKSRDDDEEERRRRRREKDEGGGKRRNKKDWPFDARRRSPALDTGQFDYYSNIIPVRFPFPFPPPIPPSVATDYDHSFPLFVYASLVTATY